jgi:hypothetical protein
VQCAPEQNGTSDGGGESRHYVLRGFDPKSRGNGTGLRRTAALPALPCQNSNNCTKDLGRLQSNHRKTAFALAENVGWMCRHFGLGRVGFLTLTFADQVLSPSEAQRRYRSLRVHVLKTRYVAFLRVFERQKSGRIHYHLLVVLREEIRSGFNFPEAASGTYRSANEALRREWAFWRATAKRYGFGRTELLPVQKTDEAIGRYVGKYIAKHIGARQEADKGVRLVDYSLGWKQVSTRLAWNSPGSWCWRSKLRQWAVKQGCFSLSQLRSLKGPRWAFYNSTAISAEQLSWYPTGRQARADGHNVPEDCTDIRIVESNAYG